MLIKVVQLERGDVLSAAPIDWMLEAQSCAFEWMKEELLHSLVGNGDANFSVGQDQDRGRPSRNTGLYLRLWRNDGGGPGGYMAVAVYPPARVFVMNEDGKTVDKYDVHLPRPD